ncbi:MAG: methionine--tRNA ligase [Pelagibacteraceae bacterium]|nr:methionine--tRNA ligase [Pelagibacteraceae bacterium]
MKSYYITTPIYYCNDKPHLGHAYTNVACDIIARYHKLKNEDVYFLTGTDEHGQKVEQAAKLRKISPKKLTDELSKNFLELTKFLNCSNDDFIRTTEIRHKESVHILWNKLIENDEIYLDKYKGWYSIRDEAFFDEKELIKKDSVFYAPSGAKVEWIEEESYFFKLSKWKDKLLEFYSNNPDFVAPITRFNEVKSFVKGGLNDLSVSRTTFKWGIGVPNNDNHIIYVWLDALQNYLSALKFPDTNSLLYKKYWPGVHIVGKDILRFHSVYWPAFLMAANLPPPKRVFAHGWFTNEGNKISKSLGNIIDPIKIINEYGLDEFRYFLFSQVPFGDDGDFSLKALKNRINNDLSNDYGNLVQRVCSFIYNNCEGKIIYDDSYNEEDNNLFNSSINLFESYKKSMDKEEIDKGIKHIFKLISLANIYVDKQAPWKLKKINTQRMNTVLFTLIEIIKRIAIMTYPIMPNKSKKLLLYLNQNIDEISFSNFHSINQNNIIINKPEPLFPKYEDKID